MARYVVAREDELPPGGRVIVEVAGRSIGVFNVGGRLYAVRNRCPHQGGPLCQGTVVGRLESTGPGSYDYREDEAMLECPWHGWEFDLSTGQSWFDPAGTRVKRYEVELEAGCGAELREGPYQAETYEVGVEDRYVVVQVGR